MKAIFALASATAAVASIDGLPAIRSEIIEKVRASTSKWTAGVNERFANMTVAEVKAMMGTKMASNERAKAKARMGKFDLKPLAPEVIPDSFDVKTAWPQCINVTGLVRDQSSCGSCWAFGSTEAFNERLCIKYNTTTILSPADTMSCCNIMNGCWSSSGCDGGMPEDAWGYFVSHGVVTGKGYDDIGMADSCYPYPFPYCSHHVTSKYPDCPTNEYNTPSCPNACSNTNYKTTWSNDKHFATSSYNLNTITDLQTDLVTRGSVTAAFTVYEDFLTYKSGVYHYTTGQALGGHAVEIQGWGVWTDGTPYWIVKNSWNQYWGDNGYFLIRRGTDECGIEDDLSAGAV